jgi:streptomycin 6-kinase
MGGPYTDFAPWLARWELTPDGDPFGTPETGSRLLPVRAGDRPAILKLGASEDERRGSRVMAWWNGQGAAPVLAYDEVALLMIRAQAGRSLAEMARADDDAATRLICATVSELHRPRSAAAPEVPPLDRLFAALGRAAARDSRFGPAHHVAETLLAEPREPVVLHADVHHANILDFGPLGWLAIDPWGYVGERAYDYANILKNPDHPTRIAPGRLGRQARLIAEVARLELRRLLQWAFAHAALSVAWTMEDGRDPSRGLAVMQIAGAELGEV